MKEWRVSVTQQTGVFLFNLDRGLGTIMASERTYTQLKGHTTQLITTQHNTTTYTIHTYPGSFTAINKIPQMSFIRCGGPPHPLMQPCEDCDRRN